MIDGTPRDPWERAWSERYELVPERARGQGPRRRIPTGRRALRDLLLATTVLGIAVSSVAFAARGDSGGDRETCKSNSGKAGCVAYVNNGKGVAASFDSKKGSVPFYIKSRNDGRVKHLNADMVDGKHASDLLSRDEAAADSALLEGNPASAFLGAGERAADSTLLEGSPASAFLGVNGKAADANTLDGQDSSEFLGSTAKAADAQVLDGVESDDFARVSGLVNGANGNPLSTGITSVRNGEGDYTVTINNGTFPNSGTSCSLIRPVISPVGNEFHAAVWNEAGCLIGGGAEFDVLTFDAAGAAEDATFGFIVDVVP